MMVTQVQLSVRPVSTQDRQKLANLIHFELNVHRHLDWRAPLDWIGQQPYLLAEQKGQAMAALACPPDPPNVAWLRLFAVSAHLSPERAWHALWPEAYIRLADYPEVDWAAAIPMQGWFEALLEESGFTQTHQVVMLSWERRDLPSEDPPNGITIRPMNYDDLTVVAEIDKSSFVPVWQNSKACLELAFNQAVIATVAEDEGKIVGYQISTATPMGGHLARLAVSPESQGQGIGYGLVYDLLTQFRRRGAQTVTVNTQHNNDISLSLYQKMGFRHTGEEFPIYQLSLR